MILSPAKINLSLAIMGRLKNGYHLISSHVIFLDLFDKIKINLEKNKIEYLDKPYTRFDGKAEQQETFFIKDPHGNILELKTLKNSH